MILFPTLALGRSDAPFRGKLNYYGMQLLMTSAQPTRYLLSGFASENARDWWPYTIGGALASKRRYSSDSNPPDQIFSPSAHAINSQNNDYIWVVGALSQSALYPAAYRAPVGNPAAFEKVDAGRENETSRNYTSISCYGDSIMIGCSDGSVAVSADNGATWSTIAPVANLSGTLSVAAGAGIFLVGRTTLNGQTVQGLHTATVITGPYTNRNPGFNDSPHGSNSVRVVLIGSTKIVAAARGQVASATIASPGTWTKRAMPADLTGSFQDKGVSSQGTNNNFLISGAGAGVSFGHLIKSTDGDTWSKITNPPWGEDDSRATRSDLIYRDGRVYSYLAQGEIRYTDDWGATPWTILATRGLDPNRTFYFWPLSNFNP